MKPAERGDRPAGAPMRLSVVVPVYNDERSLRRCLGALTASCPPDAEIIAVDDGSTDGSAAVAGRLPVRLLRLAPNRGPAAARNHGARHATGDIVFFVDSDVVVHSGMLERVTATLDARPEVAAVFGSYDANPAAAGFASRYKNLLHHFVHQDGEAEASTFWAGCGAIRREVFEQVGGFDERRFRRPSIEDIELGYRLRRAGHRILLDKGLQGTHLKRWTLSSLLRTDIMGRAIPWARLILERGQPVDDLNVRRDQRLSAVLVGVAAGCLALAPVSSGLVGLAVAALVPVLVLNRRLYRFFFRHGGLRFAAACLLLHWLYYLYSGLVYLGVSASARLRGAWSRGPRSGSPP